MGTSNTEFSLLISAFSLNSTWTPVVGGLLASKLGTTYTSILATGVIFLGQIILLIGEVTESLRLMAFGLFVFGLGVSPLSVVQETIIVRFFRSHGLGVSMALGLVAGKGASFVSARTSYPLSERYGRDAPFYVATCLAGLSVVINLVYILASKWLIRSTGIKLEASEIQEEARNGSLSLSEAQALQKVAEKRRVNLKEVTKLDDVFWAYIGLNILCGTIWAPFTHLAANIFQQRYQLSELDAGSHASYLLAGSIILYPVCGFIVDNLKKRPIVLQLFLLSSALQASSYFWLVLPPSWTRTPIPAIVAFGTGIGFSPLLLVVIVPQLVPLKYVSTTLGAHKSLEQTGSVIMQTLAGLALDTERQPSPGKNVPDVPSRGGLAAIQYLLNVFVLLNVFQFLVLMTLAHLDRRRKAAVATVADIYGSSGELITDDYNVDSPNNPEDAEGSIHLSLSARGGPVRPAASPEESHPLLVSDAERSLFATDAAEPNLSPPIPPGDPPKTKQVKRGELFAGLSAALVVFAWVLFLVTAWLRLRSKAEREAATIAS
ncbi:hypothetical protein PILCRDRAFT_817238 [Piloderma croceum F 1598]|uniref:Lysosomal dipeptide transporter MFSD1 n=1 Tax=Piloderma croceum (strain F 1598) TaxID=765440 RepID=A0A0C3FMD2_PILCF|nr:hypothetical protein PILCRDRAFT_817238 [Piloderma croceum F 1598]